MTSWGHSACNGWKIRFVLLIIDVETVILDIRTVIQWQGSQAWMHVGHCEFLTNGWIGKIN
jgi:hypothetical protein